MRLAKLATFKPVPLLVGAGECGAVDAVLLESVILTDQTKVSVTPAATLRCTMAEQVAIWLREDVAPLVQKREAPLRGLDNFELPTNAVAAIGFAARRSASTAAPMLSTCAVSSSLTVR